LLLIIKDKAHPVIVTLICLMAVFTVLPVVGYQALPVTAQVSRLEKLLLSQGMLVGGQLVPASTVPEEAVRVSITEAVSYLAGTEEAKLPAWFDKHLGEYETFKAKLGFEQTWPKMEEPYKNEPISKGIILELPPEAIDISDYRWAFDLQNYAENERENAIITVNGNKGLYRINWNINMQTSIPTLKIELDDRVILEQSMNVYIDRIKAAFPPGEPTQPTLQDMSQQLETPEISVLLVFRNVNINVDANGYYYYLNLSALYLKEKP